jgi:hypothetical protein
VRSDRGRNRLPRFGRDRFNAASRRQKRDPKRRIDSLKSQTTFITVSLTVFRSGAAA